jgi:hypothetical protein
MSESAMPARRFIERIDFDKFNLRHRLDQHLRDSHAAIDRERFATVVDQRHMNLAAVV